MFPTTWKHAIVVPVYKNGDAENVNNYQPISLRPVISKMFEKIVASQLMYYLEKKNLLSNNPHGFRPKLSTEKTFTVVTDEIYNNMEHKKISLLTLCDLSINQKLLIASIIHFLSTNVLNLKLILFGLKVI